MTDLMPITSKFPTVNPERVARVISNRLDEMGIVNIAAAAREIGMSRVVLHNYTRGKIKKGYDAGNFIKLCQYLNLEPGALLWEEYSATKATIDQNILGKAIQDITTHFEKDKKLSNDTFSELVLILYKANTQEQNKKIKPSL